MAPPSSFTGDCHTLGKYLPSFTATLVMAEESQPAHKDCRGVPPVMGFGSVEGAGDVTWCSSGALTRQLPQMQTPCS